MTEGKGGGGGRDKSLTVNYNFYDIFLKFQHCPHLLDYIALTL